MPAATVRTMTSADEAAAIDTIVLAFSADPMARWSWPEAHHYLTCMPKLAGAFGGRAFAHRSAFCTTDYAGVALWLPPGVSADDEALAELIQHSISAGKQADHDKLFEQMATYHPSGPHWYLPLIAVDPAMQGRGLGDSLMRVALQECDRTHLPAYLDSSNPRNIKLYERHGFEPIGTIQAGSSPTVVPMLRSAR
jgi:GNAT superfamily N-acetyltransferase